MALVSEVGLLWVHARRIGFSRSSTVWRTAPVLVRCSPLPLTGMAVSPVHHLQWEFAPPNVKSDEE
jgi:hypothetical protein